ncbi:uncharacterized protein VTP21DRAFT_994 [Calcarisporiella thermophila]|uniref:uncharacterized protein n=1 Tax=Calcarisporiella thermophila TaxID=911321 RepID=UPI003743518C
MSSSRSQKSGLKFGLGSGIPPKPSLFEGPSQSNKPSRDISFDDDSDDELEQLRKKRKLIKLDETELAKAEKEGLNQDEDAEQIGNLEDDYERPYPHATKGFVPAGYDPSKTLNREIPQVEIGEKTQNNSATIDDEDDDPLAAFMADMEDQVKKEKEAPKAQDKARRDDIEEEDALESYLNHMKKRGIVPGQHDQYYNTERKDADSDEEVYATAKMVEAQMQYDSDDNPIYERKRDVEPLAKIDHAKIEYREIEKYFYEEHPEIASLSSEQVLELRRKHDIHVTGVDIPKPCPSFAHFGLERSMMEAIDKCGYVEPTPIQMQAVPVGLCGRDIIGIAKTGTGKTAAFIWPMLVHIMDQEELEDGDGPIGLILVPTRELATQIQTEAKKFARVYGLRVSAVYGGKSKMDQFKELRAGVEILVATPGRLIDLVKMKATNLRRVSYFVLDEADRMFDLGFEPQVRSIADNIRPDRQTLLFSATFQSRVEKLAREVTTEPVRVTIGTVGQANTDVTQIVHVFADDTHKWPWLMSRLPSLCIEGSVLIFVARIGGVDELSQNIRLTGIECGALHGEMMQNERGRVVRQFRDEKFPVLVATDIAARGLDIKIVKSVINYDIARDIDSHIHRIGRTGRAGEKGTAYTLVTQKEDKFAGDLVRNLEASGQSVPNDLLDLAMRNSRFRNSRLSLRGVGYRGRGRGRRRERGFSGRDRGGGYGAGVKNANFTQLGTRAGLGSVPSQSSAGNSLTFTTSSPAANRFMREFQRAKNEGHKRDT